MAALARRERARRASVRAGLVTIVGIVGLTAFAVTAQNGMPGYVPGVDRNEVRATFSDVGALREGDEVRIAGVRAGFVDSITLRDGLPVVEMHLDGQRPVYADASAYLGARSALGQKYVELDPGTEAAGEIDDAGIADEATAETVELDDVLGALDPTTREAAGSALRQTGGGLAGRGGDLNDGLAALPHLLGDTGTVSGALTTDGGADVAAVLVEADQLAGQLDGQSESLAALTTQLAGTLDALAVDGGRPLEETLQRAPEALAETQVALDALVPPLQETGAAAAALRPGAVALGDALPDTRGVLREAVGPLEEVQRVAPTLDTAVLDLTPTVEAAQPFTTQLGQALGRAVSPLTTVSPYAEEVLLFFRHAQSALSQGDGAGRWLRFYPVLNAQNVIGLAPIDDPLRRREAYPAPGAAADHRSNDLDVVDDLGGIIP